MDGSSKVMEQHMTKPNIAIITTQQMHKRTASVPLPGSEPSLTPPNMLILFNEKQEKILIITEPETKAPPPSPNRQIKDDLGVLYEEPKLAVKSLSTPKNKNDQL